MASQYATLVNQEKNGPLDSVGAAQLAKFRSAGNFNTGSTGGDPTVDAYDYKGASDAQAKIQGDQKVAMDTRFAQNRSDITGAINSYQTAIPQAQQAADTKYNVTGQLGLVNALETRISDLKNNTSGTGAGGYASNAQVDNAVNSKYLPQYNTANANLGRSATLAAGDVATAIDPYKTQVTALNDQIVRESTGYTQEQQNELTTLLTKMNQGFQLSQSEADRANQLALADKQYANASALADKQAEAKKNDPSSRYINIGNGDQVYDVVTGKIVANNPKTFAATGSGSDYE